MRAWLVGGFALFAVSGCDPPPGGGGDAGPDEGDATTHADADGAALACARLAGEGAFAARLAGSAELTRRSGAPGGTHEVILDVWFPEGRWPGAPAWITHAVEWPSQGVTFVELTLDASGGATFELYEGVSLELRGRLIGPDGGAVVDVELNLAEPMDDVGDGALGSMVLCPIGEAPSAELHAPARHDGMWSTPLPLSPLSPLFVGPTSPWASEPALALFADGAPIDVDVEYGAVVSGWGNRAHLAIVRPRVAFPPGRALEVRASGSDVLGRPYALAGTPIVLETSAVLTDLSFDTPAPDGAILGARIEDGKLRFGTDDGRVGAHQDRVLVALGEPPGSATRLRVSHRLFCAVPGETTAPHIALITSGGSASIAELPCADATTEGFTTLTLDVPGPGPLHLAVDRYVLPSPPQTHPGYSWIVAEIDELAFE